MKNLSRKGIGIFFALKVFGLLLCLTFIFAGLCFPLSDSEIKSFDTGLKSYAGNDIVNAALSWEKCLSSNRKEIRFQSLVSNAYLIAAKKSCLDKEYAYAFKYLKKSNQARALQGDSEDFMIAIENESNMPKKKDEPLPSYLMKYIKSYDKEISEINNIIQDIRKEEERIKGDQLKQLKSQQLVVKAKTDLEQIKKEKEDLASQLEKLQSETQNYNTALEEQKRKMEEKVASKENELKLYKQKLAKRNIPSAAIFLVLILVFSGLIFIVMKRPGTGKGKMEEFSDVREEIEALNTSYLKNKWSCLDTLKKMVTDQDLKKRRIAQATLTKIARDYHSIFCVHMLAKMAADRDNSVRKKTLQILKSLHEEHPYDNQVLNAEGFAYLSEGSADKAIAIFNEAARIDSQNLETFIGLTLGYCLMRNSTEAFNSSLKAMELKLIYKYLYLGKFHFIYIEDIGNKIIGRINNELRLDNKDSFFFSALSGICSILGFEDKANVYSQKADSLAPGEHQTLSVKGIFYANLEKWPEAIDYFSKASKLSPKSACNYTILTLIYLHQGQIEPAETAINNALKVVDNASVHFICGKIFSMQGKIPKALQSFEKATRLEPRNSWMLSELGKIYRDNNNKELSKNCFQKAKQLNPHNFEAYYDFLQIKYEKEKSELALAELKKAIEDNFASKEDQEFLDRIYRDSDKQENSGKKYNYK